MAFSLIPHGVYRSVYCLTGELLVEKGVSLVLADLDNTLARYGQSKPDPALKAWVKDLHCHGIQLFILSNSRKPTRVREFALSLDVPFLGHAGKPKAEGYQRALAQMGCRPEAALMVGDQIFTDVLGANRAGIKVYLIEPIDLSGNPGRYLRYGVETPFRLLGRRRRG